MAPNWMGMTDKAIERAKLVAGDRYVVFVADMYGQGTRPADFGEAAALANPLRENAVEQRKRIRAAYDAMVAEAAKRNLIDGRRAAIGFCFGGGNVLELARDGADIAAAVSIHGDLKTAQAAKQGRGQGKAAGHARRARPGRAEGRPRRFRKRNGCGRRAMADAAFSAACCTPIPIRAPTFRASPAGTSRRAGRLTRSRTSSSPTRSRDDCKQADAKSPDSRHPPSRSHR